MDREIKFRAWDKIVNEMVYPKWCKDPRGTELYLYESPSHPNNTSCLSWVIKMDSFIPLQYTGLKDKNSEEIYEGDIITNGEVTGQVEFSAVAFRLFYGGKWEFMQFVPALSFEIIGNIYENPELLKENSHD